MNDADFEAAKERIKAIVGIWHKVLGLDWWRMTYLYSREKIVSESGDGFTCLGMAHVQWQYQAATITLNVPSLADESDSVVEMVVIHEMMHVFLHETREQTDDWAKHEDRVASTLTSAIIRTRNLQGNLKTEEAKDGEVT